MISSHLIPFEEASLKLEELPQAVRLAEQLGTRSEKGLVLHDGEKKRYPLKFRTNAPYICIVWAPENWNNKLISIQWYGGAPV